MIQRALCCANAACFNESSGVPCAADKVFPVQDILAALSKEGYEIVRKEWADLWRVPEVKTGSTSNTPKAGEEG